MVEDMTGERRETRGREDERSDKTVQRPAIVSWVDCMFEWLQVLHCVVVM